MEDVFTNRTPDGLQGPILDEITDVMLEAAAALERLCPAGRYRALAFTNLEQVSMWAKKSVLFDITT